MKRFAILAACAAVLSFAVTACSTTSQSMPTPTQVAARVCPPVEVAITSLQQVSGMSDAALHALADAQPVVSAVCAAGSTVDAVNLQTLASAGLPAIVTVVKASPLSAQDQDRIVLGVTTAQILLAASIAAWPSDQSTDAAK
ncbi:hypothetical protein [Pandoraea apista]|uniref:Lipoprotein n=1 Tax=Pandoraea apista TaxID=93218 RepID=A0A5E5PBQ0_9BURK|nr:hypothetical protein [Pandoraea apista]OXS92610.1 hypothetical protein B7H01_16870 [Pandoraea apista]PTE00894.1 hypothetical protein C7830_11710 [Pandoraea apista]RRJ30856.1 hypothetical protein EIB05_13840 [Pandoraea apista]RRJ74517.1 hypothetical protein EIL82_14765 [Pandoraea apista]RSD06717.1 hypothetical protein EJB12_20460 [Pandoraea apista]